MKQFLVVVHNMFNLIDRRRSPVVYFAQIAENGRFIRKILFQSQYFIFDVKSYFVVLLVGDILRVNHKRLQFLDNFNQRQFILDVFTDQTENKTSFGNNCVQKFMEFVGFIL